MRIIVTGGAGFIGSAIVWQLNLLGYDDILIVDRMDETDKWKNLVPLTFEELIEADEFLLELELYEDADVLIHMGACSSTTEQDSKFMLKNNYRYSIDLVNFAIDNEMRFIYASSAAAYGDGSAGMADSVIGMDKLRPLNVYGYSKLLFDRYIADYKLFDRVVGLRYFNVFGPNENHKGDMRSLVNKAYDQIKETGKLQLFKSARPDYADGEFGRDFVYVKDAVSMTLHFLETDESGLFNVGSGQMNTWNTLADAIFSALDLPRNVEFIDMPEHLRDRYQYHTRADITRIRKTGYKAPITPLEGAVDEYIREYLVPAKYLGDQ